MDAMQRPLPDSKSKTLVYVSSRLDRNPKSVGLGIPCPSHQSVGTAIQELRHGGLKCNHNFQIAIALPKRLGCMCKSKVKAFRFCVCMAILDQAVVCPCLRTIYPSVSRRSRQICEGMAIVAPNKPLRWKLTCWI